MVAIKIDWDVSWVMVNREFIFSSYRSGGFIPLVKEDDIHTWFMIWHSQRDRNPPGCESETQQMEMECGWSTAVGLCPTGSRHCAPTHCWSLGGVIWGLAAHNKTSKFWEPREGTGSKRKGKPGTSETIIKCKAIILWKIYKQQACVSWTVLLIFIGSMLNFMGYLFVRDMWWARGELYMHSHTS